MVVITSDILNILLTLSTTVNRDQPRLLILKQSFLPRFTTVENSGETLFWSVWTLAYFFHTVSNEIFGEIGENLGNFASFMANFSHYVAI